MKLLMYQPKRKLFRSCMHLAQMPLSPSDINIILRENEHTQYLNKNSPIKGYETNQLTSNQPNEDTRTEGSFVHKNAFICGVFDGHGGQACSQVISKRLLRYIAAGVTDKSTLMKELRKNCNSQSFLKCHNDKLDFVKEIKDIYEQSFHQFAKEVASLNLNIKEAMEYAFLRLDRDISNEALTHRNMKTLLVAVSGAVACVAYVENRDVYVANAGDCMAVIGVKDSDTGLWSARRLSNEHNTDNLNEVNRALSEHPKSERETVIRGERLCGQLLPTRALGDFRYKWSLEVIEDCVTPIYGSGAVPPHYYTPPYLTAKPEITHHKLSPADKFLVVASDGLWDFLSPAQVVNIVGEHMAARHFFEPVNLIREDITLGEISQHLASRNTSRNRRPLDENSATHLIRSALGATEYGYEQSKISHLLTLSPEEVRLYRDDITITIVYFNSEYLKNLS